VQKEGSESLVKVEAMCEAEKTILSTWGARSVSSAEAFAEEAGDIDAKLRQSVEEARRIDETFLAEKEQSDKDSEATSDQGVNFKSRIKNGQLNSFRTRRRRSAHTAERSPLDTVPREANLATRKSSGDINNNVLPSGSADSNYFNVKGSAYSSGAHEQNVTDYAYAGHGKFHNHHTNVDVVRK
jgi:hypothetical protein